MSNYNFIDLTGKKFGLLTVLERVENDEYGGTRWRCQCRCGKFKIIRETNLKKTNSCSCLKRKGKGEAGLNALLYKYKDTAKKQDRKFNLTKKQFKELTSQNCFYCGNPPNKVSIAHDRTSTPEGLENSKYIYNGIDRVDNNIGYIFENCVPCCKDCNRAKSAMTLERYKEWLIKSYNHLIKKESQTL